MDDGMKRTVERAEGNEESGGGEAEAEEFYIICVCVQVNRDELNE